MEDLVYNSPEEFRERPVVIPKHMWAYFYDALGNKVGEHERSEAFDRTNHSGSYAESFKDNEYHTYHWPITVKFVENKAAIPLDSF